LFLDDGGKIELPEKEAKGGLCISRQSKPQKKPRHLDKPTDLQGGRFKRRPADDGEPKNTRKEEKKGILKRKREE